MWKGRQRRLLCCLGLAEFISSLRRGGILQNEWVEQEKEGEEATMKNGGERANPPFA